MIFIETRIKQERFFGGATKKFMGNLRICGQQPKKLGWLDKYLGTCIMCVGTLKIIQGTDIFWGTTKI